jgi:hypothetical protein
MTTTLIFITAEEIGTIDGNLYDYSGQDRILKNIFTGEHEVLYSGQNQGKKDSELIDAVNSLSNFKVFYRRKKTDPFTFLGDTNYSSIVKERIVGTRVNALPTERLQIRLVIPLVNFQNTQIPNQFEGSGCYKKSVLQHCNFPIHRCIYDGFYTM